MYYLEPEKPLRLAIFYGIGGNFNLAIRYFEKFKFYVARLANFISLVDFNVMGEFS
jgi:hypothetical protein